MKKLFHFAPFLVLSLTLSACAGIYASETSAPSTLPGSTIPASDCILTTLESTTADGKALTLSVIGKTNEYAAGVREIQVRSGDTLLQSIFISEAIAADGADGIEPGYSQASSPETAAAMKDVNFDGHPDLEVTGWLPNNAIPYYYWIWDPGTEQFTYAFTLPLHHIDREARQLVTWYKVENGLYHTDYYEVDETNTPVLVNQDVEDVRP